jgi:DnaJ-class molecular chaperone
VTGPEIILTPLPDPDDEAEQHDCNVCHGDGAFSCSGGCHTRDCDECDGSGRLDADDNPVPANEVRY